MPNETVQELLMFMDFREQWPPPEPWRPRRSRPPLTKRGESVVAWVIAFNLLMLFVGPLAGASIVDAILAVIKAWN